MTRDYFPYAIMVWAINLYGTINAFINPSSTGVFIAICFGLFSQYILGEISERRKKNSDA